MRPYLMGKPTSEEEAKQGTMKKFMVRKRAHTYTNTHGMSPIAGVLACDSDGL